MGIIRSPKDFWIALIYLAFGGVALFVGWEYRVGSAGRMGPGYFPRVLAWALIGLGVISLVRSVWARGEPVEPIVAISVTVGILAPAIFLMIYRADSVAALASLTAPFGGPWIAPAVLAGLATILAVVSPAARPLMLISLGCALFGWILPRGGLISALLTLCLVSAAASREFRFDAKASLGLIALIIFCAAVFVKGLGVPMPLWGTWFEPYVGGLPAILR